MSKTIIWLFAIINFTVFCDLTSDEEEISDLEVGIANKNVFLIFIENINYLLNNHDELNLPNIKRLKSNGVVFNEAYSERQSTSSAATILTGLSAIDTGMIKGKTLLFTEIPSVASTGGLQNKHLTIAEIIKNRTKGHYQTGFVGYWKLGHGKGGNYLPHHKGFDYWTGIPFAHTTSCKGLVSKNEQGQKKEKQSVYVALIQKTLPWWICVLVGILSAYYFKVISWKGLLNALIYTVMSSFMIFVLLKVYRIQKSASCVLYEMNEILEQPYHPENLTLFFTASVTSFLNIVDKKERPFFLHLNYLKLRGAHFSSRKTHMGENRNSSFNDALHELDWSIGHILDTLASLNMSDNTLLIITGNNDCVKTLNSGLTTRVSYQKTASDQYSKIHAIDEYGDCLRVPIFMHGNNIKRKEELVTISFLDIAPTILDYMIGETYDEHQGCSLLREISSQSSSIAGSEQTKQNGVNSMCDSAWRIHYHYTDITTPAAVTVGNGYRIVFKAIDENGMDKSLQQPLIFIREDNNNSGNFTSNFLQGLYDNISKIMDHVHTTRKNKWSSQFEMPIYPWLLPCVNFPRCEFHSGVLEESTLLEMLGMSQALNTNNN